MANLLTTPFDVQSAQLRGAMPGSAPDPGFEKPIGAGAEAPITDEEILEIWRTVRKESLDTRKAFEIQWRRNIYYILNRQWLEFISGRGWRDKRMAPWIPRPVTNKCKETLQAIRAMFTSIKLGVNVRPSGADPKNVSAAFTADQLAPVLHEAHSMDECLTEFDFWLVGCGNAFIHTFVDYDMKYGRTEIPSEECQQCHNVYPSTELQGATPVCPDCGSNAFQPALDEMGQPIVEYKVKGKPTTLVLSPLEVAFPNSYARFSDLPYIVRLRWRTKHYFESNAALAPLVPDMKWEKTPHDQNLNLFQSLSQHNDLGISTGYLGKGGAVTDEDGISEYEVWMKPTEKHPQGLVFRVYGEGDPVIAHLEEQEALPGPLPYKDIEGKPLFTFAHAGYDHVGGRIIASGPLDAIIQKQDQLNQLDSMILLIIQRMSNPVWLTPKGAEIQKFTGMPGLVLRWNPLTVGGNAKPERIAGEGPHPTLFTIREQYLRDIEELSGTFDIMKGAKPSGVDSFAGMQLLVERSQSRFASVFQARGDMYKQWFQFAIELEREFGPDERTKAILSPARTWTFQNFKRTQLQGAMSVIVEDGTAQPKTNLGIRAAVEHANGLHMLNMEDPDQQYEGLKLFGLTRMVPTLDIHVQAALQKQQAFEEWVGDPTKVKQFVMQAQAAQMEYAQTVADSQQALTAASETMNGAIPPAPPPPPSILVGSPLEMDPWFNPIIHKQELIKWANSDVMREMFKTNQIAKKLVAAHLAELDMEIQKAAMQQMAMQGPPPAQGAGRAMGNSNANAGKTNEPKGQGEGAQKAGPR
jgi:hypothetical protein